MKKLSISNIAWSYEFDDIVYKKMSDCSFSGIEIAPTRLFENPYEKLSKAKEFSKKMMEQYGFEVCSMQSIWYGVEKEIFATEADREFLLEYSKKAASFAAALGCGNIVFGCPKNRNIKSQDDLNVAFDFFGKFADISKEWGVTLALEPNPEIYGTNFLNFTEQAIDFVQKLDHSNLKLNADLGTIISNDEKIDILRDNIDIVNHIHISEPFLEPINRRGIHSELKELIFDKFISIEMKTCKDIDVVLEKIEYVGEIFR